MFKIIFGCIFMSTVIFSEQELEFQVKKINNKKIEILVTGKNNGTKIQIYQIKDGDTLSEISLKLNNSMGTLIKLNNIKDKNLIITNKKIKYIEKKEKKNEI